MKKKFICITTMLCICLSVGCGNQNTTESNSDKKAETQRESETPKQSEGENDSNEIVETPQESNDPNQTVTKNDSSTEKSDTNSAQSSTSTTSADFYAVATSLSAQEVEAYADNIRSLILDHDWNGLANELSYPVFINGTTQENSDAFLSLNLDNNISQAFLDTMDAETCHEMFCNWEGISMGASGEIWINEIVNDDGSSELKITGINGIVD